jgi:hypothetical protein
MKNRTATMEKVLTQRKIKELYPELIEQYEIELCNRCTFYHARYEFLYDWFCSVGMLPVTGVGGPCPYCTDKKALAAIK